jgi:hypothetical protein
MILADNVFEVRSVGVLMVQEAVQGRYNDPPEASLGNNTQAESFIVTDDPMLAFPVQATQHTAIVEETEASSTTGFNSGTKDKRCMKVVFR